jgi:uncharacterized protein (DUF302 family)
MKYYIDRMVDGRFEEVIARVTEALKAEGFGVLSDIDVRQTLKAKIGQEFRPYRILGACNPRLAFQALSAEANIGVMLPCNVTVQEHDDGRVEVATIDPAAAMQSVANANLSEIASLVREKLQRVVANL